jgi:hypothetical protein
LHTGFARAHPGKTFSASILNDTDAAVGPRLFEITEVGGGGIQRMLKRFFEGGRGSAARNPRDCMSLTGLIWMLQE